MIDSQLHPKVTIIIEYGDETTKYTIPKARNVEVDTNAIEARRGGYLTGTIDFKLELKADFDEEKHHIFLVETSSIGRPVDELKKEN